MYPVDNHDTTYGKKKKAPTTIVEAMLLFVSKKQNVSRNSEGIFRMVYVESNKEIDSP